MPMKLPKLDPKVRRALPWVLGGGALLVVAFFVLRNRGGGGEAGSGGGESQAGFGAGLYPFAFGGVGAGYGQPSAGIPAPAATPPAGNTDSDWPGGVVIGPGGGPITEENPGGVIIHPIPPAGDSDTPADPSNPYGVIINPGEPPAPPVILPGTGSGDEGEYDEAGNPIPVFPVLSNIPGGLAFDVQPVMPALDAIQADSNYRPGILPKIYN